MIGTLSNENQARRLTTYLKRKGIENKCDVSFDAQTGHMAYQIWVHDEDQIPAAIEAFEEFQKTPSSPEYDTPIIENFQSEEEEAALEPGDDIEREKISHRFGTHFTTFMLALCSMIFFLNTLEEIPMLQEGLTEKDFFLTPIQAVLLYDLPPAIDELEKIIEKYQIAPDQKVHELPAEVKAEIQAIDKIPFWRGIYDWILLKVKGGDTSVAEGPLFQRILQGEVWRLFTPAILHSNLLHILFNMIWLWVLGRPIEQRIGMFKTALLTLSTAILSNTAQYLMSGPFFLGYSGIVMGLAGFIWMREKVAPWEGYPLNRATILFILLFIGSIFVLQLVAFFIQIFSSSHFEPNIANTAHIVGALVGIGLGRLHYFAQRVAK